MLWFIAIFAIRGFKDEVIYIVNTHNCPSSPYEYVVFAPRVSKKERPRAKTPEIEAYLEDIVNGCQYLSVTALPGV
jgi:hypothetical protein